MLRRSKIAGAGAALALSTALCVMPAMAASAAPINAAPAAVVHQAPVTQTALPVTGTNFVGEISDLTVRTVNGALQLTGTIDGLLNGQQITDTFTATIEDVGVGGACTILDLDLGPLHLDLLGLEVDLNQIQLDITAVPGAGNLLGNLLCAVAGLLDGNGPLQGIGALLNRLLTGLGL